MLARIQGQVKNRLAGTVAGIEDGTEGVTDRIGRRIHPAAHHNALTDIGKNTAIIGHLQVGLFRSRIIDVHTELATFLAGL